MVDQWPDVFNRLQYHYWPAEYFDWSPFYFWVAPFAAIYVLTWIGGTATPDASCL
jgi:hypothetical protein